MHCMLLIAGDVSRDIHMGGGAKNSLRKFFGHNLASGRRTWTKVGGLIAYFVYTRFLSLWMRLVVRNHEQKL